MVSYSICLIFMVKVAGRYANPMDPMVKGPSFYPAEKNVPMKRATSLSKDGDVIEPQKRCEESWVVAVVPSFFVGQLGKSYCKPLVDWEV